MNCQHTSGIFLNRPCTNTADYKCSNCTKMICQEHQNQYKELVLCETCFWNKYLFSKDKANTQIESSDTLFISTSSTNDTTTEATFSGFEGGNWSEEEKLSVEGTFLESDSLTDDDTFFFS